MPRTTRQPAPTTLKEALAVIAARDDVIAQHEQAIAQRDATIQHLRALLARRFAGSSERLKGLSDDQLLLFKDAIDAHEAASKAVKHEVRGHSRRNGRVVIPADLPRERVVHDLSEEERACPCCGKQRLCIGHETTEVLEYVPASMKAIVHERKTYACPECAGHFQTAELPTTPFDRSKAGPGLLSMIAVSKYADHLPLYRQEGIFRRHGVTIPRSTQSDWMRRVAEVLEPLEKRIGEVIRSGRIVQNDDTPVKLRDGPRAGRTEARFWVSVGDAEHRYVAFDFARDRRGEHPARWLRDYAGAVQCDAYAGYNELLSRDDITAVGCWAHARRYFHEARTNDPSRAMEILGLIQDLYAVESRARRETDADADADADGDDMELTGGALWAARRTARQEHAKPIIDAIFARLDSWRDAVPPKSALGKAIQYALNLRQELARYLDDGMIEIDNNACERAIRGVALGRKNWLFAGSEQGGRTAATIFTVLGSARLHEIEPWAYLRDVLTHMPHAPASTLDDYLPLAWTQRHPEAKLPLNR